MFWGGSTPRSNDALLLFITFVKMDALTIAFHARFPAYSLYLIFSFIYLFEI